jgi:Tol biopolymer transport system component
MRRLLPDPMVQALICLLFTILFSSFSNSHAQNKKKTAIAIPYPQPFPDSIAMVFLPNLVSKDSVDFNACFSPDGKSFYFTRSMNKQSNIYVTHYKGLKWTEPMLVSLSGTNCSDADPAFAADGKLYFISNRLTNQSDTTPDYDIWFCTPLGDGTWSAPENFEQVNSDSNEFYVSFSGNGNLYFASSRKGGFGAEDIYVSRLMNGQYLTPENLGAGVNSPKSEYDPCISVKEDLLVFTSSNRQDSFGGADLYCSKPDKTKKWQQAIHLGKHVNTNTRDFCPYFSPDAKYFFFSSERNVKWINARYVME